MVVNLRKAPNSSARCRSPSGFTCLYHIGAGTINITSIENSSIFNQVEAAGRAIGQSATKFYTKNNREGRLGISAL